MSALVNCAAKHPPDEETHVSLVHQIRLQGPWQCIPPGSDADSAPIEITIPAHWRHLFGDVCGSAIFRRTFHRPTGLEPENRVILRLPSQAARIDRCSLNAIELVSHDTDPLEYEATNALHQFNRLEIVLHRDESMPAESSGLIAPVLLEIHG
jgi:hypothetical protein